MFAKMLRKVKINKFFNIIFVFLPIGTLYVFGIVLKYIVCLQMQIKSRLIMGVYKN